MLKIHIGCGKRQWPGWVNVDGAAYPHIHHHHITDFADEINEPVNLIYASHLISYFDRVEIIPILKCWYNLLSPGGILRLAVPDWDNMVLAIRHYNFQLKDILGPLYGKMLMGDKVIYHKTVYTFSDLKEVLAEAGFKTVRRYQWRETEHAEYDDQSQAYLPKMDKEHGILISLNVEAIK